MDRVSLDSAGDGVLANGLSAAVRAGAADAPVVVAVESHCRGGAIVAVLSQLPAGQSVG